MTQLSCEFEEHTALAAASGAWTVGLAEHAASCAVCQIIRLVAEADQPLIEHAIPSADLIWWQHQIGQRAEIAHRTMRIIDIYERAGTLLLMVAMVAVGVLSVHAQRKSGPSLLVEAMITVAAIICVAALAAFSIASSQAQP